MSKLPFLIRIVFNSEVVELKLDLSKNEFRFLCKLAAASKQANINIIIEPNFE